MHIPPFDNENKPIVDMDDNIINEFIEKIDK